MKKLLLLTLLVISPNLQAMYMLGKGSAAMASARRRHNDNKDENKPNHTRQIDKQEAQAELNVAQKVVCCLCLSAFATCFYLDAQNQSNE
jgi:hypothetical protein